MSAILIAGKKGMNMSSMENIHQGYEKIGGYRGGALYCKMDLHTHTPASECSSFTLPSIMENVFPQKGKLSETKWREQRRRFIVSIARGNNPFEAPYDSDELKARPRIARRPRLRSSDIQCIAEVWLDDVRRLNPPDTGMLDKTRKEQLDEYLTRALVDLRNYLKSLFFPEEFVLRCYIEGLQIAALTDHNHPGYIVPRIPELGTWLSALQTVNVEYVKDIHEGDPSGEKVRQAVLERLRLAKVHLETIFDEISHKSPEISNQHKDCDKDLSNPKNRLEHINDKIKFWECRVNKPHQLILLPGVEITVSDVHVLALFPPKWYVPGRIGSILRAIGIPEEQWGRGFIAAASSSVQDTISMVDKEGGIVIPAHSNSDFKGLLRLFKKGLALTKVLEHPALSALESIGGSVLAKSGREKAKDAWEALYWLESGQARPNRLKPLCFIKGSDAHECRIELDGTGEDMGIRFTHVKMDIRSDDTSEEIFRSLRLALLCGQSRIIESPTEDGFNYIGTKDSSRVPKEERTQLIDCEHLRPTILGITVKGGYADGLSLRFNPYLNCVVGSGGKSTLVRLVSYAFGAQGFLEKTNKTWLPQLVRVFWHEPGHVYCVEREGGSIDPNSREVTVRWLERDGNGEWQIVCQSPDHRISNLKELVDIWPPSDEKADTRNLFSSEGDLIRDLVEKLEFRAFNAAIPLLINQPRDIFNSHEIFNVVLSKPHLKARQIIWSTGSPNVPTALDAEKIIITGEKQIGKSRQMELICGGDLHEDEIREKFLNHFEGGWLGFARRAILYSS